MIIFRKDLIKVKIIPTNWNIVDDGYISDLISNKIDNSIIHRLITRIYEIHRLIG